MFKEILHTSKISQVDKILHIADVHISNFKRHDEYKSVFEKLYKLCNIPFQLVSIDSVLI